MARKIFSKEEIDKASSMSIYDYIKKTNIGVISYDSHKWCHVSINGHDSIVVDKLRNYFIHNGNSSDSLAKGNIINFVRYFEDKSFEEAMATLLDLELPTYSGERIESKPLEPFVYDSTQETGSVQNIYRYLGEVRKIDRRVINELIKRNLVAENKHDSIIFKWELLGGIEPHYLKLLKWNDGAKDNNLHIVGASIQGTVYDPDRYGKRGTFKQIMTNSRSDYGFNVVLGNPNKIFLFEATIDLLSYWTLHYDELHDCRLVAMEGLKKGVRENIWLEFQNAIGTKEFQEFICVDNDVAGQAFVSSLTDQRSNYYRGKTLQEAFPSLKVSTTIELPKNHKDYNDELRNINPLIHLYSRNQTNDYCYKVLVDEIGIDSNLLNVLLKKNLVFESTDHKIIFNCHDKGKVIGQQAIQVTDGRVVLSELANGSKKTGTFSLSFGKESEKLYVFENPLDMLSFCSIYRSQLQDPRDGHQMMCLYDRNSSSVVDSINERLTKSVKTISFCLKNNDENFKYVQELVTSAKLKYPEWEELEYKINSPRSTGHWSKELKAIKQYQDQIQNFEMKYGRKPETTPHVDQNPVRNI